MASMPYGGASIQSHLLRGIGLRRSRHVRSEVAWLLSREVFESSLRRIRMTQATATIIKHTTLE